MFGRTDKKLAMGNALKHFGVGDPKDVKALGARGSYMKQRLLKENAKVVPSSPRMDDPTLYVYGRAGDS